MKEEISKKSWDEFRDTGLFLFINQFLHIFGWALIAEMVHTKEINKTVSVYPARVTFRGFEAKSVDKAYAKITKYMKKTANALTKEITDDSEEGK